MATLSADSDHSTTISRRSLIDTTLARLKDATLQFDADYLRPSACHSTGVDIIRQLAADACALHLSPEYIAAHPDVYFILSSIAESEQELLAFCFPGDRVSYHLSRSSATLFHLCKASVDVETAAKLNLS
ncbi:hypothetical protein BDZ97DRAFT_1927819 [Flammula alnicola]|nr:hypothetical protein BDZ97DRAFT_1927819 [Flammula alnicola]